MPTPISPCSAQLATFLFAISSPAMRCLSAYVLLVCIALPSSIPFFLEMFPGPDYVTFSVEIGTQQGLEDLLSLTGPYNSNLIPRMRRRFSGQMIQAVNEQLPNLARDIYLQTEALPQTETEHQLILSGYQMNGLWHAGNDAFVMCYKGTKTFLLKAQTEKEHHRAVALQTGLEGATNCYLTPFEIQSHEAKNFLIMPFYSGTLETVPKLSVEDGQLLVNQVTEALLFLHERSFMHMECSSAWFYCLSKVCPICSPLRL
jgi:hypothetical protein